MRRGAVFDRALAVFAGAADPTCWVKAAGTAAELVLALVEPGHVDQLEPTVDAHSEHLGVEREELSYRSEEGA